MIVDGATSPVTVTGVIPFDESMSLAQAREAIVADALRRMREVIARYPDARSVLADEEAHIDQRRVDQLEFRTD